ncbi:hypothetical protein [Methylosinus sp. Ce-a6]|uniref:hypothetical protein n=1 Tax=Methylosinus sp. Ce-a6 TaxID=2172005 RepID=UPI0013583163|nr:hypothetical protein [Methylosinus sp. Ce-a6]
MGEAAFLYGSLRSYHVDYYLAQVGTSGANASHVSFVPSASSPLLAMSEDHALLRLIIANALGDSVVVSDALEDSMLDDPDAAGALLSNLGVAAMPSAAAYSSRIMAYLH